MQVLKAPYQPGSVVEPPVPAADPDKWMIRKVLAASIFLATLLLPSPLPASVSYTLWSVLTAWWLFLASGLNTLLIGHVLKRVEPVEAGMIDQCLRDAARSVGAMIDPKYLESPRTPLLDVRLMPDNVLLMRPLIKVTVWAPVLHPGNNLSDSPIEAFATKEVRRIFLRNIGRRRFAMLAMALEGETMTCEIPQPSNHDRLQALAARRA